MGSEIRVSWLRGLLFNQCSLRSLSLLWSFAGFLGGSVVGFSSEFGQGRYPKMEVGF